MRALGLLALVALFYSSFVRANDAFNLSVLPDMGPAPGFMLVSQDGAKFELASLRGKVVVVTFIYASCPDICSTLTYKMAHLQNDLGGAFSKDVAFVSITFNPERDTIEVLKAYAEAFDADPAGWFFLTGNVKTVRRVAAQYGVITIPGPDGTIDHNLLTTLIDRRGRMRVQYKGFRFDPAEMQRDLRTLMLEP